MRLLFINPNATVSMTEAVVATACALTTAEVAGWTNHDGPPAIEGAEDGERAVPGVLSRLEAARDWGADAIVIACFDDTGLERIRASAHCPVIGIGEAAFHMAALMAPRFRVMTSVEAALPVIGQNISAYGFAPRCAGLHASGIPVLDLDSGTEEVVDRLAAAIRGAGGDDPVVLGCAGMSALRPRLAARLSMPLVDGVAAAALLAESLARLRSAA
ncbi:MULTISPECIES: aspartate/glutamate racemase family protein [unclassified Haematobacter]|uniref:aspartate/glutamate racemase family protein n=1 Tax=unclassified Haematobacter TaxID=2640585 RepID=UPI0025C33A96|nr:MULTISPECIES: aspartate/glutamate racemase family protein [unclassified Haematobacter]